MCNITILTSGVEVKMLSEIKSLELVYFNKITDVSDYYEQSGNLVLSVDKLNLSARLRTKDSDLCGCVISKEDGKYYIKSDLYLSPEEWYEVAVKVEDKELTFTESDDEGTTTIYCELVQ